MDPTAAGGRGAHRRVRRARWRQVVFLALVAWVAGAVLVTFFRGLPDAVHSGSAEAVGAAYQPELGTGWSGLAVVSSIGPSTTRRWVPVNYSDRAVSVVRPARGWHNLSLRLVWTGCSPGQVETIALHQGARVLGHLSPTTVWTWYTVPLAGHGEVRLQYSCTETEPAAGAGVRTPPRLAIALSGLRGKS
jgi:hypothetical protein